MSYMYKPNSSIGMYRSILINDSIAPMMHLRTCPSIIITMAIKIYTTVWGITQLDILVAEVTV